MAEFRSDSVDELIANFSEEQFARAQDCMERRARETAPGETTPAPSARMGMFMPTSAPELRGRKNLAMFLERFHTWASVTGCDSALDSEVVIKTSGTPRAELERLYNRALVDKSLRVWQSLKKALEKEQEVLKLVMEIGSPSVAWRALKKMVGETEDDAHDRAKREFETLHMDDSESVSEHFARVNIILMKLERYDITTSAREIKRVVMNSLTPRFPNETSILAMRGDFNLAELELGLIRVEKLRSESSRSAPSDALAQPGPEVEPEAEAERAGGQAGATAMVGTVINKDIHRCTTSSTSTSTSHPRRCHNSRTHGNSSCSSSSRKRRCRNNRTHGNSTTSSPTPGAAGDDHPISSSEGERITSVYHDIGEDIRLTGSAQCVSNAARRNISPQTA